MFPYGATVETIVGAISALRAKASGAADDKGLLTKSGGLIVAPADANAVAYSRSTSQASFALLFLSPGQGLSRQGRLQACHLPQPQQPTGRGRAQLRVWSFACQPRLRLRLACDHKLSSQPRYGPAAAAAGAPSPSAAQPVAAA